MSLKFTKSLLNLTNVANEFTKEQVLAGATSYFCANVDEKVPAFDKAPCETVSYGINNTSIVQGRDRNGSWASGIGGKGGLQCGMIDLVAGRGQLIMANNKKENKEPLEGLELVGPMFHSDAARVYISQKCESIDKYFGLAESGGKSCGGKSAVAMKADHIRIIGREKVRIYAGRGTFAGFDPNIGETNSLGERLSGQVIELQVGNQELHPMVLGRKLVEYLKKQQEVNRKVYGQLITINQQLAIAGGALSVLTAGSPPFSAFAKQNLENLFEDFALQLNSIIQTVNYLDNNLIPGTNHILSNSVYTT